MTPDKQAMLELAGRMEREMIANARAGNIDRAASHAMIAICLRALANGGQHG
jgi:hypothetical protein